MGKVSVVRTGEGIAPALIKALDLIGGIGAFVQPRDIVMLKPNINGTEGLTQVELVESLVRLLLDFDVKKIFITESSFGNERMTDIFFHKSGYTELAKKYSVTLLNLNRSQALDVTVKRPHILKTLKIAREVFEADRLINIPVMKVHYATGITLALKNLKGLLVLGEKRHFHEVGLDKAIVDLNNTVKPDLNVIDGICCMERMGPRGGDPVDLNLLIAGASSVETDYVGSQIMEHTLDDVKHLQLFIEDNGIDLSQIEVVGERIEDVKYPFKKARMSAVIPLGFSVYNIDACSSCMSALFLSFEILGKETPGDRHVFLGRKTDPNTVGAGYKIAFGNCCDKSGPYDMIIKGCPPYPFDLKDRLAE